MENRRDSAAHDVVTRREFTVQSALAVLSTVVITVSGCGDDSPPTNPTVSDIQGNVATNHPEPHVVTVTGAQITAGNAVTLTLTGTSTHTHTVELTQNELGMLRNRQAVTKTSTTDSFHSHGVTFTPA